MAFAVKDATGHYHRNAGFIRQHHTRFTRQPDESGVPQSGRPYVLRIVPGCAPP